MTGGGTKRRSGSFKKIWIVLRLSRLQQLRRSANAKRYDIVMII